MSVAKVKALFYCILILAPIGLVRADSLHIEEAFRYFDLRAENSRECIADVTYIDKSIFYFEAALKQDPHLHPDIIAGLLKAYEFKGARTEVPSEDKIAVFEKGISLGKKMMVTHPDHPGIKYWYMANLGRWAQEVGVMKAARTSVASEIKEIAEWMMEHAPLYDEAGPYRVLGSMHMELPRIPFIISWPSDKEGLALLEKAYEMAPQNYGNTLRYARALLKEGYDEKAMAILEPLEKAEPRKKTYIEDLHNLKAARILLAEQK
ncbi:tetratricopeptide repeat protein [Roseivirga sp. BDSF3-8]|uniref:tetratricopeptide repeat protein n=1 Tax=Roseivirga sp. BDSF3-8 TaxID=3241598 RepID=UPI0035320186